jgi:hypothetical protein
LSCGVLAVVGVQFGSIVGRNVAVSYELAASRNQIARLRAREVQDERTLRRLSDPRGAVPEIHEKLRWVGPKEELIYLRGAVESPAPTAWGSEP